MLHLGFQLKFASPKNGSALNDAVFYIIFSIYLFALSSIHALAARL